MIQFFVPGKPQSQGSKRWLPNGSLIEANRDLRPWRASLTAYALQAMSATPWTSQGQPVRLTVTFFYTRPKAHYRTGKNAGKLKDNAPTFNSGPYDLDKTIRGVGDALQDAGLIVNDAQIVQILAQKRYAEQAGTLITVEERK